MGATWLQAFLQPLAIYVGGVLQTRDNRVNFRNGFSASQVLDELGRPRLTIDVAVANATSSPDPNTVVLRNGSGATAVTTLTSRSLSVTDVSSNLRIEIDGQNRAIRLYDNTGALTLTIDGQSGEVTFPSQSIIRAPFVNFFATANWSIDQIGSAVNNVLGTTASGEIVGLVPDATITEIHSWIKPAAGHVGLPATMPSWSVYQAEPSTETLTLIHGPVTDSSASVVAYESLHAISATGLNITLDTTKRTFLALDAENGANAIIGLECRGLKIQNSIAKLRRS